MKLLYSMPLLTLSALTSASPLARDGAVRQSMRDVEISPANGTVLDKWIRTRTWWYRSYWSIAIWTRPCSTCMMRKWVELSKSQGLIISLYHTQLRPITENIGDPAKCSPFLLLPTRPCPPSRAGWLILASMRSLSPSPTTRGGWDSRCQRCMSRKSFTLSTTTISTSRPIKRLPRASSIPCPTMSARIDYVVPGIVRSLSTDSQGRGCCRQWELGVLFRQWVQQYILHSTVPSRRCSGWAPPTHQYSGTFAPLTQAII